MECDRGFEEVGDVVFVRMVDNGNTGESEIRVASEPCVTNMSHEPKLRGWVGSTNNQSVTARGLGRVTQVFAHGERIKVAPIARGTQEERDALASLDWSSLAEAEASATP